MAGADTTLDHDPAASAPAEPAELAVRAVLRAFAAPRRPAPALDWGQPIEDLPPIVEPVGFDDEPTSTPPPAPNRGQRPPRSSFLPPIAQPVEASPPQSPLAEEEPEPPHAVVEPAPEQQQPPTLAVEQTPLGPPVEPSHGPRPPRSSFLPPIAHPMEASPQQPPLAEETTPEEPELPRAVAELAPEQRQSPTLAVEETPLGPPAEPSHGPRPPRSSFLPPIAHPAETLPPQPEEPEPPPVVAEPTPAEPAFAVEETPLGPPTEPNYGPRPPRSGFLPPIARPAEPPPPLPPVPVDPPLSAAFTPAEPAPLIEPAPTKLRPVAVASVVPAPPAKAAWRERLGASGNFAAAARRPTLLIGIGIATVFVIVAVLGVYRITRTAPDADRAAAISTAPPPSDPAQRLAFYQKGADAGDTNATLQLAIMYAKGEGVAQDYATAAKWFQVAADKGNARAQYDLGVLYERGRGVTADVAIATSWYRKAAEGKFPLAEFNLAVAYTKGQGTRQDLNEATLWYRRAAGHGVVQAMINLAVFYERGDGVTASPADAYAWYLAAGRRGNQASARRADELFAALARVDQVRAQGLAEDVAASIHDPAPDRKTGAEARSSAAGPDPVLKSGMDAANSSSLQAKPAGGS